MKSNPEKAVQAITNPAPLTLAQLALFEKIDAPILYADITSLRDNLIAVWIYKTPITEVARNFERREELALVMSEKMSGEEYGEALTELIRAVTAFYEMMPRKESGEEDAPEAGEDASKKVSRGSATGGLPSSRNGSAGLIITRLAMFFAKPIAWIWHSFTGAGRKA